jgi:hypothetical protein
VPALLLLSPPLECTPRGWSAGRSPGRAVRSFPWLVAGEVLRIRGFHRGAREASRRLANAGAAQESDGVSRASAGPRARPRLDRAGRRASRSGRTS